MKNNFSKSFNHFLRSITQERRENIRFLTRKMEQVKADDPQFASEISRYIDYLVQKEERRSAFRESIAGRIVNYAVQHLFVVFVCLPVTIVFCYQLLISTPRYESRMQLIVKSPPAAPATDPSAIFSNIPLQSNASPDVELLEAHIYSVDMLAHLDEKLFLKDHYSKRDRDGVSRLPADATIESFLDYYQDRVEVQIDLSSSIMTVKVDSFDPEYSVSVAQAIASRAEWFINSIGRGVATQQVDFMKLEHDKATQEFGLAQSRLLAFQRQHNILDPEAEGLAKQQITYSLQNEIAAKQAKLRNLSDYMNTESPQVKSLQSEISALQAQLLSEREQMSSSNDRVSVSQVMSDFADLKIRHELASNAYISTQLLLEQSRVDAYRQMKYLVVVESPTTPQEIAYPRYYYNSILMFIVMSGLFGVVRIVFITIKELRV